MAGLQEVIDAAQVFTDPAATKLIDLRNQPIQEFAVVRDDNRRTVEGAYGLLQHVLRRHIQMVRRLVEYQQVHRFQQQTYHRQSAAFTAAEHLYLLIAFLAPEHECSQDVVDAKPNLTLCHVVDGLEHR